MGEERPDDGEVLKLKAKHWERGAIMEGQLEGK